MDQAFLQTSSKKVTKIMWMLLLQGAIFLICAKYSSASLYYSHYSEASITAIGALFVLCFCFREYFKARPWVYLLFIVMTFSLGICMGSCFHHYMEVFYQLAFNNSVLLILLLVLIYTKKENLSYENTVSTFISTFCISTTIWVISQGHMYDWMLQNFILCEVQTIFLYIFLINYIEFIQAQESTTVEDDWFYMATISLYDILDIFLRCLQKGKLESKSYVTVTDINALHYS